MQTSFTNLLTGMLMLAAILFVWSRASQADTVLIEQAIELAPSQLENLARGNTGRLIARPCQECPPRLFRIDANTRYEAAGASNLARTDFFDAIQDNRDAMIVLFYLTGEDRVSRLRLFQPAGSGRSGN